MNQQPETNNNHTDDTKESWEEKCRQLTEKLANLEHQQKKIDIQIRNDLQFQKKRANEFEQKYKNAIKYKNEQEEMKKILTKLNETLTSKQNQILEYIKLQQEKKRKINELDSLNEQLAKTNDEIKQQLSQIKQGAISALLEKDNIISSLQQKLIDLQNIDTNGMQETIVELEEKYKQLEEKTDADKHQMEGIIQMKDEQIRQMRQKFQVQRERYEEKIAVLEQDVVSYEKHIQKINQQKNHEENIQEKYYALEQKQRKTQKKLQQLQLINKSQKQDLIDAIQKLQADLASRNEQGEQLKTIKNKIKELEKEVKNKSKETQDVKHNLQKIKGDYLKKITQLQQEKKKVQDSFDLKANQLDRLRVQIQQNKGQTVKTPQKKSKVDKDVLSLSNQLQGMPNLKNVVKKQSSQQSTAMIEKLKAQIKSLQENIEELNSKLEQEMKEVQSLRQKLVTTSGSAGRSDGQAQLLVQIQDLNSYIKKVQHNLMITKLKYAEDESHWTSRESELKKQIDKIQRKSKKEKLQLLERIDRMKKTNVKDKKTDYYQSSLK